MIRLGAITRVSALNLAGSALPAILGLVLLPGIVSGLGVERFGALALALALLEYAMFVSFGMGPATTKYVAEDLARDAGEARRVVLTATAVQAAFGLAGGLIIILAAPLLAQSVFTLSVAVEPEATTAFRVVGALLPVTLVLGTLFGALEGARRFGYSNALRVPIAAATFVVPAVMVTQEATLASILAVVTAVRAVACVVALVTTLRVLEGARSAAPAVSTLRRLLSFGAWISILSVLSSILVYAERFMLGAVLGARAVGFYAAPFDTLLRVLIIPASLVRALFPNVSAARARGEGGSLWPLFRRATSALLLIVGPPLVAIALMAPTLLGWWLGPEFAEIAGMATRLLAIGILFNSLAQVPTGFLIALGRPDIPTKFQVIEVVAYLPLAWWLIGSYGVTGAALAWTTRVTVDAGILFVATDRVLRGAKKELQTA